MSAEFTQEFDQGVALKPRRNWLVRAIIAAFGVVVLAAGGGFLLYNYGHLFETAPAAQLPISVNVEESVSLEDFKAFQQDMTAKLEAATQATTDQQADLKRLADQVAALVAKVDGLQSAPVAPAAPRPPVVAQTKRPPAPKKPPSTISVGGAPLPPQALQ